MLEKGKTTDRTHGRSWKFTKDQSMNKSISGSLVAEERSEQEDLSDSDENDDCGLAERPDHHAFVQLFRTLPAGCLAETVVRLVVVDLGSYAFFEVEIAFSGSTAGFLIWKLFLEARKN